MGEGRGGSEKLKDRARRIVSIVTGLDYDAADALLRQAKWNVKAAIVMQKSSLTLPQALKRLKKADDLVRDAIGEDIEPRLREGLERRTPTPKRLRSTLAKSANIANILAGYPTARFAPSICNVGNLGNVGNALAFHLRGQCARR